MTCSATSPSTLSRIHADVDAFDHVDISVAGSTLVSDLLVRVAALKSWSSAAEASLITRADALAKPPPRPHPAPPRSGPAPEPDPLDDEPSPQPESEGESDSEDDADTETGPSAQDRLTREANSSARDARRKRRRAELLKLLPDFQTGLVANDITPAHVDVMVDALNKTRLAERDEFIQLANDTSLDEIAAHQTVEAFAHTVQAILAGLREETPEDRLARQKALSFLNIWDNDSGMTVFNGEVDPETGNRIREILEADVRTLWAANKGGTFSIPPGIINKQRWLRAQALIHRLTGTNPGTAIAKPSGTSNNSNNDADRTDESGRTGNGHDKSEAQGVTLGPPAELVLFADYDKLTSRLTAAVGEPCGHFADGTPVGAATIRRLGCDALVLPMIFKPDGEPLDSSERARTANRAQRRALQKMYNGCMFCDTQFLWCQIHHFWHWLDNGPTKLWNQGPLCGSHHHDVHDRGYLITRNPDGTLNLETATGHIIATTTVAHPQPPTELNIARDYQPTPQSKGGRLASAGGSTKHVDRQPEADLTDTIAWHGPPPSPDQQPQAPARDPDQALFQW